MLAVLGRAVHCLFMFRGASAPTGAGPLDQFMILILQWTRCRLTALVDLCVMLVDFPFFDSTSSENPTCF